MLWVDTKFLKMISPRLERFKIKHETPQFLANCRCPLCGDSQVSQKKARGYFYSEKSELYYKCWNCGASTHFSKFLKGFDPNLYKTYTLEKFVQNFETKESPEPKFDETKFIYKPLEIQNVEGTEAEEYLRDRMIPEDQWHRLFYARKFYKWAANYTDKFEGLTDEHSRLIIPWFNSNGDMFAFQGRALSDHKMRYYTVMLNPDEPTKVFGLDKLNKEKTVYVLEGALDSLFIPNSVAVGSSTLYKYGPDDVDCVYIPDADYRNKEVVSIINKMVNNGLTVCLLPHDLEGKDINDYIRNGMTQDELISVIDKNTFRGAELALKFALWRKV